MAMKKESFTTLIFDCDDTLWKLDSNASMRLVANYLDVPHEKQDEFIQVFRDGIFDVIDMLSQQKVTRSIVIKHLSVMIGHYLNWFGTDVDRAYEAICLPDVNCAEPYPETMSVLRYLREKGYRMVAKSNWFANVQVAQLKKFGFLDYFELVSGPIGDYFKPNPKCLRKIIGNNDPSHYLVIGDSLTTDIKLANNVGIKSIWINHNSYKKAIKKSCKPTFEVSGIEGIIKIL